MDNLQPRCLKIRNLSNAYVKEGVLIKYRDSGKLPSSVNTILHEKYKTKKPLSMQEILLLKRQGMLALEDEQEVLLYNWNQYKIDVLKNLPYMVPFKVINK